MSVREDTYLNRMPYTITHALKGDLDPSDGWKQLLMAVEDSHDDGPPLDVDFRDHLELCHRRKESPTERLLSELGHKEYRVCHLRKWLRAQGLMHACELLEATGGLPVKRSWPTYSKSWMYEPEPEYRRNQSVEERGGGKTIHLPSDHLTTYGSHAGGEGGTVELEGDVLTYFGRTEQPEAGDSMSEGAGVVESPSKSEGSSEVERASEPGGTSAMDKSSESGSADVVERPNRSEVTSAVEGRSEPEGAGTAEIVSKSEGDSVVEEPKEVKDANEMDKQNPESISQVNLSDPNSKHATFRRREEAQPDTHSPLPSESHAPFEAEGGPYHQHRLVGSETVRHHETTASGGGDGSSPKKEGGGHTEEDRVTEAEAKAAAEFRKSLKTALAQDSVEVEIVKSVTLGPPEAGKTQLKSALVGRFDVIDQSTPMSTAAEVVMQRYISGRTSWEPLTRKRLLKLLHRTVEKKEFAESGSATSLPTAKKDASASSPVVDQKGQPLPIGQTVSGTKVTATGGAEAMRKKELLQQFSDIRSSVEQGLQEAGGSADIKSLQKIGMIHFIDSGGQPAFFDIHPVIATSRAVYLLVYNMEKGLEDMPEITYRKNSFPTKELTNKKQSNLDMIKDSLLILYTFKKKFAKLEEELHQWFGKPISQFEDAVPVLVVGTRKKEGSVKYEGEKLSAGCGHLPNWCEVLNCTDTGMKLFAVDSMDPDCKGLHRVRNVINRAQCTYSLRLPISWVLCQLIFWSADADAGSSDLHVLIYADLRDLCLTENIVANDTAFLTMIRTFHLLGIFSFPYFDQELTLGDKWEPDTHPVFTNPDVLYQQVTKILEVAFRHLEVTEVDDGVKQSLLNLQSSGILKLDTLEHLSIEDKLGSYNGFHSYLLELLVKWGLAARLPSKDSDGSADSETNPEYFIPSVLPACEQESISSPTDCSSFPPDLAFTFLLPLDDGTAVYYVPRGIFPHMITNTLTAGKGYNIPCNKERYKCRYRDAATFMIRRCSRMNYSYNVRLTDNRDHISISIQPSDSRKTSDCDCHQIIQDFQSAIEDAYEQIYCTPPSVMLTCPCPCRRSGKDHLAAILRHHRLSAQYIQECLSAENDHWEQDCPKNIANIMNATAEASVSGLKRPPACGETLPMKRKDVEGTGQALASANDGGAQKQEAAATHVQVIEEHRQEFLKEMDAKTIAKALWGRHLIPEPVKNSILQSMCTEDANVELLTFLKSQASENQIEAIFKFVSEQTDYGRMSEFATYVLQKLQQVTLM